MKKRIVSILLALSLSVCTMVGLVPSSSAYSLQPHILVYPFVSYHLGGQSFFEYDFSDRTGPLSPFTRYEYKLGSQHNPQAFGFFIECFYGFSDYTGVQINGVLPSFFLDPSSSSYTWRQVTGSNFWQSSEGTLPIYYQWVDSSVSIPDFSSPGVLWDGGIIPLPRSNITDLNSRLRLFVYAFTSSSASGWYGLSTGGSFSFQFVNSRSETLLSSILQSISSSTNPTLTSILSSVNEIKDFASQQSSMHQFESDYLTNFQNQVNKTEDYLGSNSPVLPNNFVPSSGGGSSFVDSVKDNIGLSSDSLDMSDFANASQSFSGSASTGDGGMWQFFTQDVADSMSTGGTATIGLDDVLPPDDFESELSKWLEDSERWLDKWSSP